MRKRIKRFVSLIVVSVLTFTVTIGRTAVNVHAAEDVDTWGWDDVSDLIDASKQLEDVLLKFEGFTMENLNALAQDEDFFDMELEEILSEVDVPEDYEIEKASVMQSVSSAEDPDQELFEKQLKVLTNATIQNRARGMAGKHENPVTYVPNTFGEDFLCMYMSHYVDGNQGTAMYFSEYGYQSQNMADWMCDEDRKAFKRYIETIDKSDRAQSMATIGSWIGTAFSGITAANVGEMANVLDFMVTSAGTVGTAYEDWQGLNWGELDQLFKECIDDPDVNTMREFRDVLTDRASRDYSYISSAGISAIVTVASATIFSVSPVMGLAFTFASAALNMVGDAYYYLNNIALAASRNIRISYRLSDWMEYYGYW